MMTASVMKELIEIYWLFDATNLDMLTITLFNNTLFFISNAFFQLSLSIQFEIFNPWKVPWNWIAFCQNYFVLSHSLLYHLIRSDTGRLANEAFTSNSIVSSKQQLSGLKITNCKTELNFKCCLGFA